MSALGFDCSSIQGTLDFQWLTNNGYQLCIARNYVGNDFRDQQCDTYLAQASSVGMKTAVYNFIYILPDDPAHPNRSPEDQAALHFANTPAGQVVCIDCEYPAPNEWTKWGINAAFVNDWVNRYITAFAQLSTAPLIFYTYPGFANAVGFNGKVSTLPLWLADYENQMHIPMPWKQVVAWQNSGTAIVNGKQMDTDLCFDMSIWNI